MKKFNTLTTMIVVLIFFLFINTSFVFSEFDACPYSRQILILVTSAGIYERKNKLEKALEYYKEALFLSRELEDKRWESFVLIKIGRIYETKEMFDEALKYYQEALEKSVDLKEKALICSYIGEIYIKEDNYYKGIEYLEKGIEFGRKIRDYESIGICMLKLGKAYEKMKDYVKAEEYFKEGLIEILKTDNESWKALGYEYIGLFYLSIGNTSLAKEYLIKSYKIYRSIGDKSNAKKIISIINEISKNSKINHKN